MSQYVEPNFPAVFTASQADLRPFDRDLVAELGRWGLILRSILDKGISITDNVDADVVAYVSNAAPNTEDAVPHGLRKIPTHFLVSSLDKGAVVYRSATAFTKTHVYLKTSLASTSVQLILL